MNMNMNMHPSQNSDISCPGCGQDYKEDNLPRILTMCGHTFCSACITNMIESSNIQSEQSPEKYLIKCPQQNAEMKLSTKSLDIFPKNLALMKILQGKNRNPNNNNKSASFNRDTSFDISKIVKQEELQQDEETEELITAIVEQGKFLESGEKNKSQCGEGLQNFSSECQETSNQEVSTDDAKICLLHQKPLEIVCIVDKQRICSKCAIFGSHKGHQFKAIEELEQDIKQKYDSILSIFQAKQESENRISDPCTKKELLAILSQKKQTMEKLISSNFKKLYERVKEAEQKCINDLSTAIEATQEEIGALLQIDQKVLQKFNDWEQRSYQQIKILESKEIESVVDVLYLQNKISHINKTAKGDIVEEGRKIVSQMVTQENNLITNVEKILQNLVSVCTKKTQDRANTAITQFMLIQKSQLFPKKQEPPLSIKLHQNQARHDTSLIETAANLTIDKSQVSIADKLKNIESSEYLTLESQENLQGSPLLEQSLLQGEQQSSCSDSMTDQNNCNKFNQNFGVTPAPITHFENSSDNFSHYQFGKLQLESCQKKPSKNLTKSGSRNSLLIRKPSVKQFVPEKANNENGIGNQTKRQMISEFSEYQNLNSTIKNERPSLANKNTNIPTTINTSMNPSSLGNDPKLSKKKLKSIKVPEKYQKVLQGIFTNSLDMIDLTNAELGDAVVLQICQFIKVSKAKTIKLIRNKLTDSGLLRILPSLGNATTLNLSQNALTEEALDIFADVKESMLPNLKNLILSQNKIIERKHRAKIEILKSMGLVVSV